jgi:HK97 gp10 family phage protein
MAKIEGREQLRKKFAAMPKAVRDEVAKAIVTSAEQLTGMQKQLAPIERGTLRDSIRYTVAEGESFKATIVAGGIAETRREVRKGSSIFTDEAILMEFGTRSHLAGGKFKGALIPVEPPRAFFYPAYRALKKPIKARLSRAITTGIKKAAQG